MNGIITLAIAGGATVMTVALVVWWVIRTVRDSERRAADARVNLELHNVVEAKARADVAEASEARWKDMYAAERRSYLALSGRAVASASDADAVALAGGDPGPVGDGLLTPDFADPAAPSAALPEPGASPVLAR